MNRNTSKKIAAIGLFVFGGFEIMGLMMLFAPKEYLPPSFEAESLFWALLSGIYGVAESSRATPYGQIKNGVGRLGYSCV